jgi:hypothetical protein
VEQKVVFADAESMVLRAPRVEFKQLAFGPLDDSVMISARIAPALIGLGLLEAISDDDLLALAKQTKPHGIRGKPNYVWDIAQQRTVLGRFGLKANQPNLAQQTLTAFHQDLGVTSYMYPEENCTPVQAACAESLSGGHPELGLSHLNSLLLFLRAAAPPARRDIEDPEVRQASVCSGKPRALSAISPRSEPVITMYYPPHQTRLYSHTPICCYTRWVMRSRTDDQTISRAGANGGPHRCGDWDCNNWSAGRPAYCMTGALATLWKRSCGTEAKLSGRANDTCECPRLSAPC